MRLKVDENISRRAIRTMRDAGHDVATVAEQGLESSPDRDLARVCAGEGRALVSLDLDFANVLVFDPLMHAGIAVLRLPARPSHADMDAAVRTFVRGLQTEDIVRRLWIVEAGRIRVHGREHDLDEEPDPPPI